MDILFYADTEQYTTSIGAQGGYHEVGGRYYNSHEASQFAEELWQSAKESGVPVDDLFADGVSMREVGSLRHNNGVDLVVHVMEPIKK